MKITLIISIRGKMFHSDKFSNIQEQVLSGGHGLMVQGYDPVIKALARDIDIRLNHRYHLYLRISRIVNSLLDCLFHHLT